MTQLFEGSFSKVSLHLTKLPLKLLLCEENSDPHLFSVSGHLVSASSKNNPGKMSINKAGVVGNGRFLSEVRTTPFNLSDASKLFFVRK